MAYTKLQFKPGIVRDVTRYSNNGGWFDSNRIRFRMGFPETIGGWTKLNNTPILGTCRSLHNWSNLAGTPNIGAGTNLKFYVLTGNFPEDITPMRVSNRTVTFTAGSVGSNTVTVNDAGHGALLNDFVTFSGAASLGGNITAAVLNREYQITGMVSSDAYTITTAVAVAGGDTGNGGASSKGAYQINVGLDTVVLGGGWGAGTWSRGTWNSEANVQVAGSSLRLWSQDNFGEDLIMCIRGGGIFYWDLSGGVTNRAVALSTLSNAQSAPTVANIV